MDKYTKKARQIAQTSHLLKTMAHEQRLLILCVLGKKDLTVSEIIELTSIPQSTVSQHLQRLRLENLVSYRKSGKNVIYSLSSDLVKNLISTLQKHHEHQNTLQHSAEDLVSS